MNQEPARTGGILGRVRDFAGGVVGVEKRTNDNDINYDSDEIV